MGIISKITLPDNNEYYFKDSTALHSDDVSTAGKTGSYNDLIDKPSIPSKISDLTDDMNIVQSSELETVAFTGEYGDLHGLPTLHSHANKTVLDGITADKVASWDSKSSFDGDYNNLTNKPVIPTEAQMDYWDAKLNESTEINEAIDLRHEHFNKAILDDIDSVKVAYWNSKSDFDGAYSSLSGKPTLFNGDYNSLSNKPTIPNVPSWALETSKPSYSIAEITGLQVALDGKQASISDLSTIRSDASAGKAARDVQTADVLEYSGTVDAPTTGSTQTLQSLTLPAGRWSIEGTFNWGNAVTTARCYVISIGTTTNVTPGLNNAVQSTYASGNYTIRQACHYLHASTSQSTVRLKYYTNAASALSWYVRAIKIG